MPRGGTRKGAGRPKRAIRYGRISPAMREDSLYWLRTAAKKQKRSFGEILSDLVDNSELRPQVYKEFKNAGQALKSMSGKTPPNL
jgi:hypothetical protein